MNSTQPTKAYFLTSIIALITGVSAFGIGLVNATMALNEKGYYAAILTFGLFAFVSLQKSIRDEMENIPTSRPYMMMCWLAAIIAIGLLAIGLYNAELLLSEKGFYAMAFVLSGFAAITVQKNVRDKAAAKGEDIAPEAAEQVVEED